MRIEAVLVSSLPLLIKDTGIGYRSFQIKKLII